jgi:hypothetical protein
MGLEKTTYIQLHHPAHGCSDSENARPRHVAGIGEIKCKHKTLLGKTGEKRTLGKPSRRGLDGFIMNLV